MHADATAGLRTSMELIEPLMLEAARSRNMTKDEMLPLLVAGLPELAKSYRIRLMAIKAVKVITAAADGSTLDETRSRAENAIMQFSLDGVSVGVLKAFILECTEEKLLAYRKDVHPIPTTRTREQMEAHEDEDGVRTTAFQKSLGDLRKLLAQLCGDKTRPVLAQLLLDALKDNVTVDARLRTAVQEVVRLSDQNKAIWREYSAVAAGVLPQNCAGAIAVAAARAFCSEVAVRYCQVLLQIQHGVTVSIHHLRAVLDDSVEANLNQALSGALAQFCKATDTIHKAMHAPTIATPQHAQTATPTTATPAIVTPPSTQAAQTTPAGTSPAATTPKLSTTKLSTTTPKQRLCFWCQEPGHEVSTCPEKAAGKKKKKRVKVK